MSAAEDPPVGPSASLMVMQLGPQAGVGKQRPVQSLEPTREASFGSFGSTDGAAVRSINLAAPAASGAAAAKSRPHGQFTEAKRNASFGSFGSTDGTAVRSRDFAAGY